MAHLLLCFAAAACDKKSATESGPVGPVAGTVPAVVSIPAGSPAAAVWSAYSGRQDAKGGQAEIAVSPVGVQIVSVLSAAGLPVGLTLSVPNSPEHVLAIGSRSTTLSLLFLTPGILTTEPVEAGNRLAQLSALPCFGAAEALIEAQRGKSISQLVDDTQTSSALDLCVMQFQALEPQAGIANAALPYTTIQRSAGFELVRSTPAGAFSISYKNDAWRYVDVFRRDITAGTGTVNQTVRVESQMSGKRTASWGSLLTLSAGQSTTSSDPNLTSSQGNTFEYWVTGLGHAAPATPMPSGVFVDEATVGSTILYHCALPVIDIILGSLSAPQLPSIPPAQVVRIWAAIKGGITLNQLTSATSQSAATVAALNIVSQMLALGVKGAASAPFVTAGLMTQATASVVSSALSAGTIAFGGFNLGAFIGTYWNAPSAVRFVVSAADPTVMSIGTLDTVGTANAALRTPVAVTITDAAGSPVGGIPVRVRVTSGGGSLQMTSFGTADASGDVSTGTDGRVVLNWILGAPGSQGLSVSVPVAGTGLPIVGSPATIRATSRLAVGTVSIEAETDLLALGESLTLFPIVLDVTGRAVDDRSVSFTSSNTSVLTAGRLGTPPIGIVTANAVGTATVTATAENKSGSRQFRVQQMDLWVRPSAVILHVGEEALLTPQFSSGLSIDHSVSWTSSAPSVATVSAQTSRTYPTLKYSAILRAQAIGSSVIVASEGGDQWPVNVVVLPNSGVSVPSAVSPADGTLVNYTNLPRLVSLVWTPVAGATLYEVEFESCGEWSTPWQTTCTNFGHAHFRSSIRRTAVTNMDVVGRGDQPHRWRVRAIDGNGRYGHYSAWRWVWFVYRPNGLDLFDNGAIASLDHRH